MQLVIEEEVCRILGQPLGGLPDNPDLLNSFKDTIVATTDGHRFRTSRLLLAAASPWLRSLLLSVPELGTVSVSVAEGGSPVINDPAVEADIVLVFDGHSAGLVGDALRCLDNGLFAAATLSEKWPPTSGVGHSQADILDFLLDSSQSFSEVTSKRRLFSPSSIVSPAMDTSPLPPDNDDNGDEAPPDMTLDIVVKIEPGDAFPLPFATVSPSDSSDDKVLKKGIELEGAKKQTAAKVNVTNRTADLRIQMDTDHKPEEELIREGSQVRRSIRQTSLKLPLSKIMKLSKGGNGVGAREEKLRRREELKKKHEEMRNKYRCQPCNKGFVRKKLLEQHRNQFHQGPAFRCPHCPRVFFENRLLQSHFLQHGRQGLFTFKCSVCDIGFVANEHLATHQEVPGLCKKNKCAACGAMLASYHELKAHNVKEHGGLEERKCILCTETFVTPKAVLEHQAQAHQITREFICALCGKDYRSSSGLACHMRIEHDAEKPTLLQCDICNIGFASIDRLRSHKRKQHSGVLTCELCGKNFKNKHGLKRHKATMHVPDEEKAYRCPFCGKGFSTVQVLGAHTNIHLDIRPYRCKVCGLAFNDHSNKLHHQRRCEKKLAAANSKAEAVPLDANICS